MVKMVRSLNQDAKVEQVLIVLRQPSKSVQALLKLKIKKQLKTRKRRPPKKCRIDSQNRLKKPIRFSKLTYQGKLKLKKQSQIARKNSREESKIK
jgi:hypothetical protein